MSFVYNIAKSEFNINKEELKQWQDNQNIFFEDEKLNMRREDASFKDSSIDYEDCGDAVLSMQDQYSNEIVWVGDDVYRVTLYWVEEDDMYSQTIVEYYNDYQVFDKPDMTKDEVLEQLQSIKEDSLSHLEDVLSDYEIWQKDIVAINFAKDLVKNIDIQKDTVNISDSKKKAR